MAGAFIEIKDNSPQVLDALQQLLRKTGNLEPAFRDIGEYLLRSHDVRWRAAIDPDGNPWAPLSAATLAKKRKNADKILVESGRLMNSLDYVASPDSLLFGTNSIYGAIHQFGAEQGAFGTTSRGAPIPWGDIPAREFIGISGEDEREILDIIHDYLAE